MRLCSCASLSLCVHVCRCVCEHVPMEVRARELHPSSGVGSSSCYGSSDEGCIHGPRRKLASSSNRPPPTPIPPPLLPRLAPDPPVNLPWGQRSMAQSCRVTVRDDEGENEKERSYTTQMGRRDEKMKRWDQIWLLSRGGESVFGWWWLEFQKMAAILWPFL